MTGIVVTISAASDIVLGVAQAADPEKYRVAAERLQRMGAAARAEFDASAWQANVEAQAPRAAAPATATADSNSAAPGPRASVGPPRQARNAADAFGQLEAFMMQTFIQSMLPKNAANVYGKGTAGEVWKSMLAEKLAGEIARSGQVGIAKSLQAGKVANPLGPGIPGSGAVPPSPALASVLPYLHLRSTAGAKS